MDIKRIKELSKALTETQDKPENKIMYGTVISVDTDGVIVELDGAGVGIPVNSTIEVNENDRVQIQFNDHEAIITGNVSDKSITRTTADGLIDVFAHNGTFSGTLSAPLGNIGGWLLTASALYRGNSTFGNKNGMYLGVNGFSVMDRFKVDQNGFVTIYNPGVLDDGSEIPYTFKFNHNSGFTIDCKSGGTNRNMFIMYGGEDNRTPTITSSQSEIDILTKLYVGDHITIPTSKSLKGLDTNGNAKSLIYMTGGDNVRINGDQCGITNIATDTSVTGGLTATGDIKSTSGKLVANNCTAWNGGVAGGLINENGTAVLVGPDANNLPRIVFVRAKSTTQYSILRALNSSGTYTLTLPNATGTLAVSSSDVRLKEHIKPSEVSGLDLINKIELKQFDWKEEAREGAPHWKIGIIADELEQLDENLVFGGGDNEDGTMNVKGIDTTGVIAYLVKAVQELSSEVKALRGELNVKQ